VEFGSSEQKGIHNGHAVEDSAVLAILGEQQSAACSDRRSQEISRQEMLFTTLAVESVIQNVCIEG
jgi:hypothetical protein